MTARARKLQRRSQKSVRNKIFLGLGVILALLLITAGAGAAWVWNVWRSGPNLEDLKPIKKGASSAVYASDGSLMGYIHSDTIRQPVPGSDMPANLRDATVAIERKGFVQHGGIDPPA